MPSLELGDQLSEDLGLKTNGTKQSKARRDKFAMNLAVAAAGIPTIPFFCALSVEEGMHRLNQDPRFHFPVVVKPLKSAGTDNLRICQSMTEVRQHLHLIIGQQNRLGLS